MADAPELLPCPFCGGTRLSAGYNEYGGLCTVCDGCNAMGPPSEADIPQIIAAWNTRAPDPRVAALVEACEALGMHIAPEDATAADPFRDIRAALAAFNGGDNG